MGHLLNLLEIIMILTNDLHKKSQVLLVNEIIN